MKLSLLIPIKPNNDRSYYQSIAKYFSFDDIACVFGLDDNDTIGREALHDKHIVTIEPADPFPICKLWNEMAMYAFNCQQADFVLLLGDDCKLKNAMDELLEEMRGMARNNIECIAVREYGHPSWPTFLACKKQCFPIPANFVNQDADPFLFERARRLGFAAFTNKIYIHNERGGVDGGLMRFTEPRYTRQGTNWRSMLETSPRVITIDIAIPMYRISTDFIEHVLSIPYDKSTTDVRVSVCIDKGREHILHREWEQLRQLELEETRLRIRVNEVNIGASATRTRLLNDNHSEYMLFLDDDVIPDKEIVNAYVKTIREHPKANGFVGMSRLPYDDRLWTDAIHLNSTFFWHISEFAKEHDLSVPWGVTANLMIKWAPTYEFDIHFPKTGGGEDIDLCIQMGARFVPVPEAKVLHPWRETPVRMFTRMFEWAAGDGYLNVKYPEYTYWYCGNFPTYLLLWALYSWRTLYVPCVTEVLFKLIWCLCIHARWKGEFRVLEHKSLARKIAIVLLSSVADNASEFGHLYYNIRNREVGLLFKRFDWFLGTMRESIQYESLKSLSFVGLLCIVTTCNSLL